MSNRTQAWCFTRLCLPAAAAPVAPGPAAQYQPVVDTFTTSKLVILDNMAAIRAAVTKLQVRCYSCLDGLGS
jgi:hypothetical protein